MRIEPAFRTRSASDLRERNKEKGRGVEREREREVMKDKDTGGSNFA